MVLDDGLILFFALSPILSYGLLRSSSAFQSQRRQLVLQLSMATLVIICIVKVSLGSSWVTMLDIFLEVLLRFLIITLVLGFFALSYVMIQIRKKAASSETMPDDQPTRVKSICFHPTEPSWMIFALYSGHVVICKGDDYSSVRYAVSPGCVVRACLFGKQKDTFLAASDDNTIRVLNHDGRLLQEFQAHDDYIRSLDILSDRSLLLSCSDDMTIKVWDMEYNYNCVKTFHGHMHYVMQVRCNPQDTGKFATASLDRTIKFWSVDEPDSLFSLHGHEDGVNAIEFCQYHRPLLVSGSDDLTVRLWNYETRQQLHILRGHANNVTAVNFVWNHDDESIGVVSTSEDCTLRFWKCRLNDEEGEAIKTIQYSPLGRGWALATKAGDLETQVAIGLDQACLVLDIQHDDTNHTALVSKETNITKSILENGHVPVVMHSNHDV